MDTLLQPMLKANEATEVQTQKRNQYIATIFVCIGAICAGTVLAWTSPVLPQLQVPDINVTAHEDNVTLVNITLPSNAIDNSTTQGFQLTKSQGSLVGSMLAMGALCAAIPAGYIADKIGRKKANLILTVPFLVNWLLIVFAVNPYMLYVARFFSGLATGAICVTAPMYIGEIAEISIRGTLGSFFQMCICFGIFLTYLLGALLSWVGMSWVLMAVPVLFALCFSFMPETPVYLVKAGRTADAEETLKYFRGRNYNINAELKAIQADIAKAEEKRSGLLDLVVTRGNRKALFSALGLMFFQQLSGINAVIFYTVPIFNSAGSSLSPDVAAVTVSIVQFIIAYVAAMIIDKANRRFYLMMSSIGMMMCLSILGLYFYLKIQSIYFTGMAALPLASLVLFIIAFSVGFGPVPWMIMGELFAPEIKGVASGLSVMTNWIFVFIVTFSFPIMNSTFGGHITFCIFAMFMLFGTAFVYWFIPETKGKSLQEIQDILNT